MSEIEKSAGYYSGYLPGDHSPIPLVIVLATTIAIWLLVYLIGAVAG